MISFVVLHFNDMEITSLCVEKILKLQNSESSEIIIVDNGSPNGSGEQLKRKYSEIKNIHVILSRKNLGFAKGNNLGYRYVIKHFDPDYIIVMNNDVLITQNDFIIKLEESNLSNEYEIIMPDIINKAGKHQNPFRVKSLTNKEMVRNYFSICIQNIIYHLPIISNVRIKQHQRKIATKSLKGVKESPITTNEMMVPHGACVIYSRRWIQKEKIAFIPDTFLYGEEDILYEYIINHGYKTFYDKDLIVHHLEDVSTSSIIRDDLKKTRFLFKNSLHSQRTLIKLRQYNNKNIRYQV